MKLLFVILKCIFLFIGSLTVYFGSIFSLASKEQILEELSKNYWGFFFTRFLLCLTLGLFFYSFSLLINFSFRNKNGYLKKTIKRLALIEFAYYISLSILVTLIALERM